ncbi:MAG: zinc-ribbon domain-containing protein [Desulfosarcina sp.]|nr:zinc-ribbon domain-containing protein [Desulfosarcina sp.]
MIITCKACNTSFNLDDKMLKPTGSKVRCSVCASVFTAFPVAAVASAKPDIPAAADTTDAYTPETDVLAEDPDALLDDGPDLDFALEDEPEDGVSDTEIEDAVSDALDEDLADIPIESELEPDLALESDTDDESGATVIASLDDDDLDLDLSPEHADEEGTATVIANLDDDDLDLSLDGQPDVSETVIADLDQEDFDLDVPVETDGDPEGTATVIANLDDDALDLDSDFPLEPDGEAESAASTDDALPETLDDMDGLDLSLDMEPDGEAPPAEEVPEAVDASLDDFSLEFDLEKDADVGEAASGSAADDDDLDLALDLDDESAGEMEPAGVSPELEDDLDLSSLEGLLKDDEESEDDTVTMVVDEVEEPDLTLDMDDETPMAEGDAAGVPGETLEDLEFDLDTDGGAETPDIDDVDDDQEIDLSEIEKMLEEPETGKAEFTSVPEQDLDLDIEASLETEKWMSESGDNGQVVKDEELDLSELEQVLDDVDTDTTDDTLEDPELELDLDLGDGEALGASDETVAVDAELEFDLSDFEEKALPKAGADAAGHESFDMELEFEAEENSQAEQTLEDEGLEETVAIPEPKAEKTEKAPPEPAKTVAPASTPKPVKKGMSKSLVFLLIIALLGGIGYGTYYLLNQNGIDIPFLSDYLKPKVQDPGNLKLTTYDINSKFVDNASVGKLFVISGEVKNGYAENRGMITLVGKIFSTGKVPVNQEKVYCGNVMSDLELANLEWDKIKERLSNRLGDNRSNVKIEPGKSVPFMVVFSGLPDDLEEFTIEVIGSTSLK